MVQDTILSVGAAAEKKNGLLGTSLPRYLVLSALAGSEDTNCLKNRRAEATVLVNRAQARGDATPSVQQVLDHMMAPIIYRLIFGSGVQPGLADQLADELFVLAGIERAGR